MVRSMADLPKMPPHPLRKSLRVVWAMGALFLVGALAMKGPLLAITSPLAWFAVAFAVYGVIAFRQGDAVQLVNRALDAVTNGRHDEARVLLDHAEQSYRSRYVQRVIRLHRAALAWMEGELQAAERHLDVALEPGGTLINHHARMHVQLAHAGRAVVRAASGNELGSEADAAIVRASPDAPPEALARAEVARAIVLQRRGDRRGLERHLEEHATTLEYAGPRDRALLRAYRRMLRLSATSVYRRPAPRTSGPSRARLRAWMASISPEAADALVDVAGSEESDASDESNAIATAPSPPALDSKAVEAAVEGRKREREAAEKRKPSPTRLLAVWVLLIVGFIIIWRLLSDTPPGSPRPRSHDLAYLLNVLLIALGGLLSVFVVVAIGKQRRLARRTLAALSDLARGRTEEAAAALETLVASGAPVAGAEALLHLSRLDERRGDFERALSRIEAALSRIDARPSARAMASDLITPALLTERAYVLTVLDRPEQAEADLAALHAQHPSYAHLGAATFRVRMLQHARTDLADAARMAAARPPELPLSARDEFLADALASLRESDPTGELRTHLRDELHRMDEGESWMRRVAPRVLASLQGAARTTSDA